MLLASGECRSQLAFGCHCEKLKVEDMGRVIGVMEVCSNGRIEGGSTTNVHAKRQLPGGNLLASGLGYTSSISTRYRCALFHATLALNAQNPALGGWHRIKYGMVLGVGREDLGSLRLGGVLLTSECRALPPPLSRRPQEPRRSACYVP